MRTFRKLFLSLGLVTALTGAAGGLPAGVAHAENVIYDSGKRACGDDGPIEKVNHGGGNTSYVCAQTGEVLVVIGGGE